MRGLGLMARCLCCATLLGGCATVPTQPPQPEPRGTTLVRFHHERISLEELAANRESALACARAIALLERELREPWVENREARVLLQHVRGLEPPTLSMAMTAWEGAEAKAAGSDREMFREFGVYGTRRLLGAVVRRAQVATLEDYAASLLASHQEDTPAARLLAGWRHLAPELNRRDTAYLASSWNFHVGMDTRLALHDSLLGPFTRCVVLDAGSLSGMGPLDGVDAYQMPREVLDLLLPAGSSPVAPLVRALAKGQPLPAGVKIAPGKTEREDDENRSFLSAALRGLTEGMAEPEYLPGGLSEFSVTFSYLLGTSEARASLAMRREGATWVLERFAYEPAAASMMGQRGAKLDLMPLLRSRQGT